MDNLDMYINNCTTITVFHGVRQETEQAVDEIQTVRDDVRANVHLTWVVESNGLEVSKQSSRWIGMNMNGKPRALRKE